MVGVFILKEGKMSTDNDMMNTDGSRRDFLKGVGASLVTVSLLQGISGCGGGSDGGGGSSAGTKVVILGSSGGVSWYPGTTRASTSTAVVVNGVLYLVDLGQDTTARLTQAFNPGSPYAGGSYSGHGSSLFLQNLRALFLTHLHQDHIADYPALLLIGPGAGLGRRQPLRVIGPCTRGQLETDVTGYIQRGGTIVRAGAAGGFSATQTPGTRQMTELMWQAFAQCINNMTLDAGYPDFTKVVQVQEIGTPLVGRFSPTCPPMNPFEVYRDDLVRVTATLVDHHQVYPAFAYRFDTADGSVAISGDTGPDTNGNLQLLANRVDVLVHEVIDGAWVDFKFGDPEPGSPMYALKIHMLQAHTAIDAVGRIAEECKAKTLVLNHIVPGDTPLSHLQRAGNNFSGRLIIGEDLMTIPIG